MYVFVSVVFPLDLAVLRSGMSSLCRVAWGMKAFCAPEQSFDYARLVVTFFQTQIPRFIEFFLKYRFPF